MGSHHLVSDHHQRTIEFRLPLVYTDQTLYTSFERSLFIQLAQTTLFRMFTRFEESTRQSPFIESWLMSPPDNEQLIIPVQGERNGYWQRIDIVNPSA